ncbi:MAG: twin-arginine translocase subunit TatC [Leptospirillia bacterium]
MPFNQHLGELRTRLTQSAIAIGIATAGAYGFSEGIIAWISRPVDVPLVFISPGEAFWANIKVALLAGVAISFPVLVWQAWRFLEPGLHPHERKLGGAFVIAATLLFLGGMAFCAWVVFPFAISFLLSYRTEGLTPMLAVGTYIDFAVKFFLAFGVVFQLPPVITLLARLGVVTPAFLSRNRKYAVLIAFIVAAILTPTPDVFNQLLMVVPLLILFELGVLCARWVAPKPGNMDDSGR